MTVLNVLNVLNVKALVGAFNKEKALVGAFSVIVQPVVEPMDHFTALDQTYFRQSSSAFYRKVRGLGGNNLDQSAANPAA